MKRWIKEHRILATLIPVLLVMGMIFCFSAQTGEDSGSLSGEITRFVVRLFVPDFDAFASQTQEEICATVGLVVRKMAHFSEFFLLGFCLMLHIDAIGRKITLKLPWLMAWGVGALYALTDEFHQMFVGGRHPALLDVVIDSAGVLAGVLVMLAILHREKKK